MMDSNQQASRPSRWQGLLRSVFPTMSRSSPIRCEDVGATDFGESPEAASAPRVDNTAPVHFEQFSREWQQISGQDNFDGFRIEAANQVTKHLQAAHTLFLGTQLRPEQYIYQFGPAFQSEDQRTMLVARCGLDGGVNGRMVQRLGTGFQLTAASHSHLAEQQRNMHEASLEYTGGSFTLGGKAAWQGAWLFGASCTKRLFPQLQLGGDLTVVAVQGIMPIMQAGLRYSEGKNIFGASISRSPGQNGPPGQPSWAHECRLSFVRRVTERLSLGTEYKLTAPDKDSGLSMGYEYSFRQARVQGLLDTDGKVSCCVSDFVGFGFSGMIDYFRGDYKFGVVMHVLPQTEGQPPQ